MIRVLSFHADYACRHAGACCTAGWIEPDAAGVCRHFDADPSGGCTVQRVSGAAALPHACQQFPRVATLSPLGTSVALSAFCPTAASLLFDDSPFAIVERADTRTYEGLDARGVLPPLLRPGMLMDWTSVARWEELTVAALSDHRDDPRMALEIIERASTSVCETWTPAEGPLAEALARVFQAQVPDMSAATALKGLRRDRRSVPGSTHPAGAEDMSGTCASGEARFLASHAFACWPMYDGRGIRGAVDWLLNARTALDEERRSSDDLREAFRQTDLRLRHGV